MRAYFVLFALLVPNLVLSQSHINKVFARRTRSHKYVPVARQVRVSRYIQEPHPEQQQEVQQKNTDDIDDVDLDLQLVDNFGQEKTSTVGPVSYAPTASLLETSTARPVVQQVQQVKDEEEDVLPQLNHPLSEFEDELSQSYLPSYGADKPHSQAYGAGKPQALSYGAGKPQGLSYGAGKPNELSYGPAKPQGVSYSSGKPNELSYGSGKPQRPSSYGASKPQGLSYGSGASNELSYGSGKPQGLYYSADKQDKDVDVLANQFGFEEDHNVVDWLKNSIRGEPGKDYPVFASVPETTFKCSQQQYPGYYADIDAQCQVFHICQDDGRSNAFLCPNGTIFSQRHFVCVWWYEFDCSTAEQFYQLNADLYKETEAKQSGRLLGGSVPSLVGGSVPSLVGGSVPSLIGGSVPEPSAKLASPKENLNKMYMAQIDEFAVTTATPTYGYSNGKTAPRNGGKNGALRGTTQPVQYDLGSVDSVTPSSLDGANYETTPYNLDEALGEEIHSETPLIESLSLTTNLPKLNAENLKSSNGRNTTPNNYYNNKATTLNDFSYGSPKMYSPKPSYGSVKGKNGKNNFSKLSQLPESPVKGARNGNGSSKPKTIYNNGNGSKPKTNGNNFKSMYAGVKQ